MFETNHPYVLERVEEGMDERELIPLAARMVRRYNSRNWIESGFQDVTKFMMRTRSPCPRFRFWCFQFGVLLANAWRIADLLVEIAADGSDWVSSGPVVTKSTFISLLQEVLDALDPPD